MRQSVFYSLTQSTPKYGSWVGMDRQKEEGKHIFSVSSSSSSSSSQDQGFKPLYSYTCYCTDCQTLVKCIFFHPHFPLTLFLFLLLQPFLFLGETSGVYLPTCLSLIPLVFRLPTLGDVEVNPVLLLFLFTPPPPPILLCQVSVPGETISVYLGTCYTLIGHTFSLGSRMASRLWLKNSIQAKDKLIL